MPESATATREDKLASSTPVPRRLGRKLLLGGVPAVLVASAALAWLFVPKVHALVGSISKPSQLQQQTSSMPVFVNLPEMTVTLPNGGQLRQLRIHLSLELSTDSDVPATEILSPQVYDAVLTYLRTLHSNELEGSLAIDRMRGDLYRRLSLILPHGTLRDVLITGLVVG